MSVQTTFFGVTKLSGKDAKKFRRQVTYGRPNKAAATSLARGEAILKQMSAQGEAKLKTIFDFTYHGYRRGPSDPL